MMLTLLPDMNIAPLKYAHVQKKHGGPIESFSFRERALPDRKLYEGFASLDEKSTGFRSALPFYANAHGSALAPTKPEAIHGAISQAIALWAWHACFQDKATRATLRYDFDATAAGFAAFPGLGIQGAKKRALFEASRLWSLAAWWDGKSSHKELQVPGAHAIGLQAPAPGISVALIWRDSGDQTIFASAASYSQATALEAARLALQHNEDVLAFFRGVASAGIAEKRMQYFASPAGFARFRQRLVAKGGSCPAPSLTVDESVKGPWTQYAHVWRCLFDMGANHGKYRDDYFMF